MLITKEFLKQISINGALNKQQVKYLGGAYPLEKGWIKSLIGREMFDFMHDDLLKMKYENKNNLQFERNNAELLVARLGGFVTWDKKKKPL